MRRNHFYLHFNCPSFISSRHSINSQYTRYCFSSFSFFFLLSFFSLLSLLLTGCAVYYPPICWKNGQPYGITDDKLICHDWDSSYRRGLSYNQGECWEQAGSQFLHAIRQRANDQWRARSYGMHVLDEYFPHRELGLTYLRRGRLQEAIDELSLSLATADSAKAKYYLNKARRQWLEETGLDQTPPIICFSDQSEKADQLIYTNCSTYQIEGQAADDFFVSRIFINNQPLFLDLAQPEILFQKKVALKPGFNVFHGRAMDLVGHECSEEIQLFLDQQGPTLVFSPLSGDGLRTAQIFGKRKVKGLIFDTGGLAQLVIGQEEIPLVRGEKIQEFGIDIPYLTGPSFRAQDLAGNFTQGNLLRIWDKDKNQEFGYFQYPDGKAGLSNIIHNQIPNHGIKICDNNPFWPESAFKIVSEKTDHPRRRGLKVFIEDSPSVVFKPSVVIQGRVESPCEIMELCINDEAILSRQDASGLLPLLRKFLSGGRTIFYFTRLIEGLKEGENHLVIRVENKEGLSIQKEIMVEYRIREIEKIGNRWCLAILPFRKYEIDQPLFTALPPSSMAFLDEYLHLSFFQTQRFHLLERDRIDEVMNELGLQSRGLVDMTNGPKLGKLLAAEVLLMGSMQETWDGQDRCLGVIARLVEVETGRILAINSVYNPWKSRQDEEYLLGGLAHIFQQDFPLMQGEVVDKSRRALEISLGADDLIKQGMKVLVYHPVEENQTILGEARVEKVVKEFSHALPSPKELLKIFEVGNLVITK